MEISRDGDALVADVSPENGTKTSRRRRRRLGQRGQNLVEFALVAPIFLVILMGIIDFGWAFKTYISLTNCAREGARVGVVGANTATITTRATDPGRGCVSGSTATVTYDPDNKAGSNVKVEVDYTYNFITPVGSLLGLISGGALPDHLDLSPSTTMRIE
jgi:Flp pilus assembly protein TadG